MNIKPTRLENTDEGLDITWQDGTTHHRSPFSWDWLLSHSYAPRLKASALDPSDPFLPTLKSFWSSRIASKPPKIPYHAIMETEEGVYQWLSLIYNFGFAFVENCPATPEDTDKLIRRIAFIRETHYGAFWDFTADMAYGDTAYSNVELGGEWLRYKPSFTRSDIKSHPIGSSHGHYVLF